MKKSVLWLIPICILLIISCSGPFVSAKQSLTNNPLKKGYLTFSVGGVETGRTIMPANLGHQLESWVYELTFYEFDDSGNMAERDPILVKQMDFRALQEDPIELDEGEYEVSINAYTGEEENYKLVAQIDENLFFSITENEGIKLTVNLALIISDTEKTGVFTWNFIVNEEPGFSAAEITVSGTVQKCAPDTFIAVGDELPFSGIEGTLELSTGHYIVNFELKRTGYNKVMFEDMMYIYANLESVFKMEISKKYFLTDGYLVKFIDHDPYAFNDYEPAQITHGDALSLLNALPVPQPPSIHHTFAGWYYIYDIWYPGYPLKQGMRWDESSIKANRIAYNKIAIRSFVLYALWVYNVFDINDSTITVSCCDGCCVYNGNPHNPLVKIEYDGIELDNDAYIVNHGSNKYTDAGTYSISITGVLVEGYNGTVNRTFTIAKAAGADVIGEINVDTVLSTVITVNTDGVSVSAPSCEHSLCEQEVQYAISSTAIEVDNAAALNNLDWHTAGEGTAKIPFESLSPYTYYYIYARSVGNTNFMAGRAIRCSVRTLVPYTLNITLEDITDAADGILTLEPPIVISRSGTNYVSHYGVDLAGSEQYDFWAWFVDGEKEADFPISHFVLDSANPAYNHNGYHYLMLQVKPINDSKIYSVTIRFEVKP